MARLTGWLPAANFTPTGVGRRINMIVAHCTQNDLRPGAAYGVANYFKNQRRGKEGSSAHYVLDAWETWQSVADRDVAWAAPNANSRGLHFEFVGRAEWSASQWRTPDAMAMIANGAELMALKARSLQIPPTWLNVDDVKAGRPGFTDHVTCSKALGGSHWDAGPNFPSDVLMDRVRRILAPQNETQPTPPSTSSAPYPMGDEHKVYAVDVSISLDDAGNGYAQIPDSDASKIVSIVGLGSFPPKDGYWLTPRFGRQMRDGTSIITAVGGAPKTSAIASVVFRE